jgi:hypothetical protein
MGFSFEQKINMDVCRPGGIGKTPGIAAGQRLERVLNPTVAAALCGPEFTRCFKFVQPGWAALP